MIASKMYNTIMIKNPFPLLQPHELVEQLLDILNTSYSNWDYIHAPRTIINKINRTKTIAADDP